MVSARVRQLLVIWLGLMAAAGGPLDGQSGATRPEITIGVRPDRVRVGDAFTVTVRVVGSAWPDAVELDAGPAGEVVSSEDRSSTGLGPGATTVHVFERDFEVVARVPGTIRMPGVVVDYGGTVFEAQVADVTVSAAGLEWGNPGGSPRSDRKIEERLLPEGAPPTTQGRTYDATNPAPPGWPGSANDPAWGSFGVPPGMPGATPGIPYGPGLGQYGSVQPYGAGGVGGYGVYGGFGRLPPGEGWAETATSDPWWPELIPELGQYQSVREDPDGLAVLQTGLTPHQVYVGQQATLVATATFPPEARYRMARDPEFFPANATDAWVVDVPWAAPAPAAVGGRLEQAHTFLRAYFPLRAGRLTIDPARLSYSAGQGAGRPPLDTLASDALTIDVLPIPEAEAPASWGGAVGRYRVSAWLTPARVGWGESALLMVEVAGVGHLPSQPRPDPGPVWGGGLRPMGERSWVEVRDGVVGGVKRFTWLVVPVEAGPVRIGPVFYSFFDPYIGAFGQAMSAELTLQVDPYPSGGAAPGAPGYDSGNGVPADMRTPVDPAMTQPYAYPEGTASLPSIRGASPTGSAGLTGRGPVVAGAAAAGVPKSSDGRGGHDGIATSVGGSPTGTVGPEARAAGDLDRVLADPVDPQAWFALGESLEAARPDEGWAEWAWRSGLRAAPRDGRLQAAVWSDGSWRADPGVPLLPLKPLEAALATGLLLLIGGGLVGSGGVIWAREGLRRDARAYLATGLLLASVGGLTAASWRSARAASQAAVVVGGSTPLRAEPSGAVAGAAFLSAGQPVRQVERYGDWVLIEDVTGRRGWVEDVRLAPLGPAGWARS